MRCGERTKSVKVVSPFGEIAWGEVSRLSDDEMRLLLVGAHPRVHKMLAAYTSIDFVTSPKGRNRHTTLPDYPQSSANSANDTASAAFAQRPSRGGASWREDHSGG